MKIILTAQIKTNYRFGVSFISGRTGVASLVRSNKLEMLGHERTHIMQYSIWGEIVPMLLDFEKAAYNIESTFWNHYKTNSRLEAMSKVWWPVVFRVLKGEENVPSPFTEKIAISSLFVMVKEEGNTKLGYGILWCPVTFRGIHLSRREVPSYLHSITVDEMEGVKLPDIKFEDLE